MGFNFNGMMQGLGSGMVGYGQAMEAQAKLDWETNRDNVKWEREKHFQELQAKKAQANHTSDIELQGKIHSSDLELAAKLRAEDNARHDAEVGQNRIDTVKMQTDASRANKELGMAQIGAQLQMKNEDKKEKTANDDKSWEDTRNSLDNAYPNLSEEKKDLLATAIEDGKQPMAAMILRGTEYDKQPRTEPNPTDLREIGKEAAKSATEEVASMEPKNKKFLIAQIKAKAPNLNVTDDILIKYKTKQIYDNQVEMLYGGKDQEQEQVDTKGSNTKDDGSYTGLRSLEKASGKQVPTEDLIRDGIKGFNDGKLTVDQLKRLGVADQVPGLTSFIEEKAKSQGTAGYLLSDKERDILTTQYLNNISSNNQKTRDEQKNISAKAQEHNDAAMKMYKKPYFDLNSKQKEEIDFNLR